MIEPTRILIIDDEPGVALLCERILKRAGFRVDVETDPRKALPLFRERTIDLLLVDIRMPAVDGFEVIRQLKEVQPDTAVLIMTGYGTVETAIRALRQGVDGLILKPFDQGTELIESVKQALQDSRQKLDAARIHALRPLFSVTELLLSETRREPLLDLILDAILDHLGCSTAACYQKSSGSGACELLVSKGGGVPAVLDGFSSVVDAAAPVRIGPYSPADPPQASPLGRPDLGSVLLCPIIRPRLGTMVLLAGRAPREAAFRESELELFQVLARQAAVALENSELYAEQLDYVRKVEESQKALLQAEKMATAGRLSATIAHEVNNPLQAVQNCLHLAAREDFPEEKRREYFEMARTELDRLMLTVQRMLDFYRPGVTSMEKVNLGEMLQFILNLMDKQLSESKVRVNIDLLGRIPPVVAVRGQLQQVFINLILNSADAMTEGGLLRITARPVAGGVELLFQDNGRGIPAEKQANIFEPFFSTKDGGTGLGLTVSYNIVTAHGGTLELVPGRGPGACFRIFLPAGEEPW